MWELAVVEGLNVRRAEEFMSDGIGNYSLQILNHNLTYLNTSRESFPVEIV
jgi:hypothetical protein